MPLDDEEREQFAGLLRQVQRSWFKGNKKDAYTTAKVNAETWRRATSGQSIKDHSVGKIVDSLFPDVHGDWRQVLSVGGDPEDAHQFVESSTGRLVESGVTNEDLLREILRSRAESDQIRARVEESAGELAALSATVEGLSVRVADLEQQSP